jgi:hypothetical protein
MDVDEDTNQNLKGANRGIPAQVILVDNNHPFDIEAYSSSYTGMMISSTSVQGLITEDWQAGRPWIGLRISLAYALHWRFQLYNSLRNTLLRPGTSICTGTPPVSMMGWQ